MDTLTGIALVVLGALCGGTFALPSKYTKASWESLWGTWYLFLTVLFPVPTALLLVKGAWPIWCAAGPEILYPVVFGFLWGVGSVAAAVCYARLGLSLSFVLIPGIQVIFGPLVPLVFQHPEHVPTAHGIVIILGILLCVIGVACSGYAGVLKGRDQQSGAPGNSQGNTPRMTMKRGFLLCLIAGLFCSCFNFAFSFSESILEAARGDFGNPAATASMIVWAPAFLGGGVFALAYCAWLLVKNKTWKDFALPGGRRVVLLALIMAVLNWSCVLLYGWGAQLLGTLGPSVGFAVLFAGMMLVGNLLGFMTGEWKGTAPKSRLCIAAGIACLVLGICVLGIGNAMAAG